MPCQSSALAYGRRRCDGRTTADTAVRYGGRQGCGISVITIVVAFVLVAISDVTGASSDFYYDNWQCNNYLSAESVVIQAAAGQLLEIHIRDDIPVSI